MSTTWVKVSEDNPCSKCGKADGCSVNEAANRGICRRVECGQRKEDTNGSPYWVFALRETKLPELSTTMGTVDERDVVYAGLLAELSLSDEHRQHLLDRSLTDSQIDAASYRSLPSHGRSSIARKLIDKHGIESCFRIPGIIKKTGRHGDEYATISGFSGTLIPARTPDGKIHGLCVRKDNADKNKYVWLSSKKSKGTGPGLVTHVPVGVQVGTEVVRLTEGILKSDVAFCISGFPTIGMPGIGNWKTALPVLKTIGVKKVIFSPDADFREKRQVAVPCRNAVEGLLAAGFEVELEVWS